MGSSVCFTGAQMTGTYIEVYMLIVKGLCDMSTIEILGWSKLGAGSNYATCS